MAYAVSYFEYLLMEISEFDYDLPKDLIAQHPLPYRDSSRLMVLDRKTRSIDHSMFSNFPNYLQKGDLLILNNTKVFPARLIGIKKNTGGRVELLLTLEVEAGIWKAIIKCSGKIKEKMEIIFSLGDLSAVIIEKDKNKSGEAENNYGSQWIVQFSSNETIQDILQKTGLVPLPPYIKRDQDKPSSARDKEYYQTIYASKTGAIAAPTAGLHFTQNIFDRLKKNGVEIVELTLHVGTGTFKPVKTEIIQDHSTDPEYYEIENSAAEKIKKAVTEKRRIIAVGTTSTRAIESLEDSIVPMNGSTNLFIYPGFNFRFVSALLTNFHLPKSTLLMLVYAFAGKEFARRAYMEAIEKKYRFYSYGDAMFIL